MEKFNRAVRRHHVQRLKANRQSYWGYPQYAAQGGARKAMSVKALGSVVDTPTPCSCAMCGNPRRFGKGGAMGVRLTIQERAHRQRFFHEDV